MKEKVTREPISEKVEKVVRYIKEKNDWVVVTLDSLKKNDIVKCYPESYKKLREGLKLHDNMAYRKSISQASTRKPLEFKYVSKEDKIKNWILNKKLELSQDEVIYIAHKLNDKNFSYIHDCILIINSSLIRESNIVNINEELISDTLLINQNRTKDILETLIDHKILESNNEKDSYIINFTEETLKTTPTIKEEIVEKVEINSSEINSIINTFNLVKESFNQDYKLLLQGMDYEINKIISNKKVLLNKEKDEAQELITKCMEDNASLRAENLEMHKELDELRKFKESKNTFYDRYLNFIEQEMDRLVGESSEKIIEAKKDVEKYNNPLRVDKLISDLQRIIIKIAEDIRDFDKF